MNKKSKKKQKKRGKSGDGTRYKENHADSDEVLSDSKEEQTNGSNQTKDKKNGAIKPPCYEVKHSDVLGRYLVAAREIRPGEEIISETALAVGPCSGCGIVCIGCYREMDESHIDKCSDCNWPLCNSCPGKHQDIGHPRHECDTLRNITPNYSDLEDLKESYHAIMPLRCLLLKMACPEKWQTLSTMEAHNDLRRVRGDIYPLNEKLVVQRIRKWGLPFEPEEIHTVCGILEVNAFEVGGGTGSGNARALYDRAFLLAHDCTPSTTHTDAERKPGRPLTVRAAKHHNPGDLISLCYAYTLQGTLKRREHLKHSKFFECKCARCSDPTELGTFASAFRCPRCCSLVLATKPLDSESPWQCSNSDCRYTMQGVAVQMLLKRLTDEYEQLDCNDVPGLEKFIHKYRNVLHSNHYLCLSAMHSLSQLYGKVENYMIHEMPRSELERKIYICRQLMTVFDVIEPGYSRLRGVTLYELHAPLMILTTRDFEQKAISKETLRTRLKEIVGYLTEAALILGFEPSQSSEGLMAGAAREALRKIRTWEQIIGKIS